MRTSEQLDKIAAALHAFQKEVEPPTKNKVNPFFKSKYADLCSLFAHCREQMLKNGLVFVSAGMTSRILHTSGQWIEGDFACETASLTAQQVGSAMTYGRRYNFQGLLGINAEEDDDGQAATTKPTQGKAAAPKVFTLKSVPAVKPATAPKVQQGAEDNVPDSVTDSHEPVVIPDGEAVTILKVATKTGEKNGKPWTRYGIHAKFASGEADWLNTFSNTFGELAKQHEGDQLLAKFDVAEFNGKPQYNLTDLREVANG